MELIYMYAGQGIRNIKNCGFNFSTKFNIEFNESDNNILIHEIDSVTDGFIEEIQNINAPKKNNLKNITLVSGKNGTGKSTILKLLGYDGNQRQDEFGEWVVSSPLDSIVSIRTRIGFYFWFALYHIRNNEFLIEGNGIEGINNLEFTNNEKYRKLLLHSIRFRYNFSNNNIFDTTVISEIRKDVGYIFYNTGSGIRWLNEYISSNNYSINDAISRKLCNKLNFNEVAKLAFSDENSVKDILPNVVGFNIQLKLKIPSIFREKMFGKLPEDYLASVDMYNNKSDICHYESDLDNDRNRQEHFVLLFLEILVWKQFNELGLEKYNIPEEFTNNKKFNDYKERKVYLLFILNSLYNTKYGQSVEYDDGLPQSEYLISYIKPIIRRLEVIECHPLSSDDAIQISKDSYSKYNGTLKEDFLKPFEEAMTNNWLNGEWISVSAVGMSTGEAHLYDIYASLYYEIKSNRLAEGGTYILLMDEPEAGLHPEWSREFLNRLVDILSAGEFTKYHWQIIITTHSPFLLSDVPKSHVICLSEVNSRININEADYGFMANIYDLLGKTFFMDSPFGELAKRIVDKNVRKIREKRNMLTADEIKRMKEIFDLIDDEIIRESLKRMI